MALIFMNSEDSSRPTEDASQTFAGVEGKMNLNQDVSAPNDKSPNDKSPTTNPTAYEASCRVKPNFGGH